MAARYIGALDQGTTSTRFMVFDAAGSEIARHQLEHRQMLPGPGWSSTTRSRSRRAWTR
jgi:glycerol kinase